MLKKYYKEKPTQGSHDWDGEKIVIYDRNCQDAIWEGKDAFWEGQDVPYWRRQEGYWQTWTSWNAKKLMMNDIQLTDHPLAGGKTW